MHLYPLRHLYPAAAAAAVDGSSAPAPGSRSSSSGRQHTVAAVSTNGRHLTHNTCTTPCHSSHIDRGPAALLTCHRHHPTLNVACCIPRKAPWLSTHCNASHLSTHNTLCAFFLSLPLLPCVCAVAKTSFVPLANPNISPYKTNSRPQHPVPPRPPVPVPPLPQPPPPRQW